MHKLLTVAAVSAAVGALGVAPAAASGVPKLSGSAGTGAAGPELVLVGGWAGEAAGWAAEMPRRRRQYRRNGRRKYRRMGCSSGGINGGSSGGGVFAEPTAGFGEPAPNATGNGGQYYTYQCATPVGRCSFVAPAAAAGARSNNRNHNARRECAAPIGRRYSAALTRS
jgi:hypothetical protein